jgi:hypothetical protein
MRIGVIFEYSLSNKKSNKTSEINLLELLYFVDWQESTTRCLLSTRGVVYVVRTTASENAEGLWQ